MNCGHATKLVDAWIDNEIDAGTANDMSLHLHECTACSGLAQQRIDTRRFVRAHAAYHRAPAPLRQRLLARLDVPSAAQRSPFGLSWRQAAAVLVFAAVSALGGYLVGRPALPAGDLEFVVAGHVAALKPAGRLTDIASAQRHTVRPWFQGKVDFAPPVRDLSAEGFVLLGARLEELGKQPAAALVYRLRAHFITLYVWHEPHASSAPTQLRNLRGFSVATWSERGMRHAAVSDLNATDLLRFAALMQAAP